MCSGLRRGNRNRGLGFHLIGDGWLAEVGEGSGWSESRCLRLRFRVPGCGSGVLGGASG
uniref:Uncharacterized protein n=1 Tax=Kalanchoe fedtschenkoi TaxID=63787 RepID=A0A7N0V4U9_KALFE